MTKIHPLTGESKNGHAKKNGKARPEVTAYFNRTTRRQTELTYDAVRSGTDLDNHWAHADALDADSANSKDVRFKLMHRSRYEVGSNGYYAGIVRTHCDMLVGTGPNLRMLTGNRNFNQMVEREWYKWALAVQLRRKLWCMAHARTQDGEGFAMLITNPELNNDVKLDVMLMEAEQVQTPYMRFIEPGYIDGIKKDEYGNVLWYDVLPEHPGSSKYIMSSLDPVQVSPRNMLHWYKLERPGAGRGVPDLRSTLNTGASSRRHREATIAAAETAADLAAISTTTTNAAGDAEPDPVAPFTGIPMPKRTWAFNPMGWDIHQMKAEHPNATYSDFHRLQISEQARPLSMPYNAAACDSSTYSFASGKLDTLCYRAALDVERADCDDLVLSLLFAEWFKEFTIVRNVERIPDHQWDWPKHPVIDAVAEENARDTRLKNGTLTMRQAASDDGMDYEDQLVIKAEDMFGEATDENIEKARQIDVLRNTPAHAMPAVMQVLGLQAQTQEPVTP